MALDCHRLVAAAEDAVAQEIDRSVHSINSSSSATARSAQQTSAITDELGRMASELNDVVSQFKISGEQMLDFEAAKSAHLAWRARIRAFLDGRETLSTKEAVSHHDCMLGKWYYTEGLQQYGEIAEMAAIEQPHSNLHQLIREIIELQQAGRRDEAEARYQEIVPLSEQIIGLLDAVEQRIRAA